jgi:hypothetical protein
MSDEIEKAVALQTFADTWSDGMLHLHIGSLLTCTEAEALAGALEALGSPEGAKSLLESHAEGDEPEDLHYVDDEEPVEGESA